MKEKTIIQLEERKIKKEFSLLYRTSQIKEKIK